MSDDESSPGLEDAEVVTKYKMAGEMANRVLKAVAAKAVEGATTISLCAFGDEQITKETASVYNKKVEGRTIEKGVGFPTCVSVNSCICHNSPLSSDAEYALQKEDVVKIDLGVHIDGYIGVAATTVVVGASAEAPVTGEKADVIAAAHTAAELALRMIKPGATSDEVTAAIKQVAKDFCVTPVEGMLTHQLQHNNIAGEKSVIQNQPDNSKKHETFKFEENEVYAVDILMSTSDGKPKQGTERTTVYRKTDEVYQLKMKASRAFYGEVLKKHPTMPFTLRSFEDEQKARLGVTECAKHGVVEAFDVLHDKEGAFVAQAKIVALLMPTGNQRATTDAFDAAVIKSEKSLTDEKLVKILATNVGTKSKKKKNRKKKPAAAAAEADPPADA
eukprot:m.479847 g.479847  ORF g.479847 m.479847 type:complete len:389 (-) comp21615_c0_seq1:224-1390(-)